MVVSVAETFLVSIPGDPHTGLVLAEDLTTLKEIPNQGYLIKLRAQTPKLTWRQRVSRILRRKP
jgi:hypothetical protein